MQSRDYNNAINQATGHIVKVLSMNAGNGNVPATNKYEMNGRTGIVDPIAVG